MQAKAEARRASHVSFLLLRNTLLQTGWLTTMPVCCLPVLEAGASAAQCSTRLKSRCLQAEVLSAGSAGQSLLSRSLVFGSNDFLVLGGLRCPFPCRLWPGFVPNSWRSSRSLQMPCPPPHRHPFFPPATLHWFLCFESLPLPPVPDSRVSCDGSGSPE